MRSSFFILLRLRGWTNFLIIPQRVLSLKFVNKAGHATGSWIPIDRNNSQAGNDSGNYLEGYPFLNQLHLHPSKKLQTRNCKWHNFHGKGCSGTFFQLDNQNVRDDAQALLQSGAERPAIRRRKRFFLISWTLKCLFFHVPFLSKVKRNSWWIVHCREHKTLRCSKKSLFLGLMI